MLDTASFPEVFTLIWIETRSLLLLKDLESKDNRGTKPSIPGIKTTNTLQVPYPAYFGQCLPPEQHSQAPLRRPERRRP